MGISENMPNMISYIALLLNIAFASDQTGSCELAKLASVSTIDQFEILCKSVSLTKICPSIDPNALISINKEQNRPDVLFSALFSYTHYFFVHAKPRISPVVQALRIIELSSSANSDKDIVDRLLYFLTNYKSQFLNFDEEIVEEYFNQVESKLLTDYTKRPDSLQNLYPQSTDEVKSKLNEVTKLKSLTLGQAGILLDLYRMRADAVSLYSEDLRKMIFKAFRNVIGENQILAGFLKVNLKQNFLGKISLSLGRKAKIPEVNIDQLLLSTAPEEVWDTGSSSSSWESIASDDENEGQGKGEDGEGGVLVEEIDSDNGATSENHSWKESKVWIAVFYVLIGVDTLFGLLLTVLVLRKK
jgi:hypothetical protein